MKNLILLFALSLLWSTQSFSFGNLVCHSILYVDLGYNCQVSLLPEQVGIDLDPTYNYTVVPSTFNCYNVGRTTRVILEQRNRKTGELVNSCFSDVTITSRAIPNPCEIVNLYCHSSIDVRLNEDGYAVLTPEMISVIPLIDNPYFEYLVTPNILDCGNIGRNEVRLRIISACFPENYCTMNVNIIDDGPFRPTCYNIDTDGMDFFPADLGRQVLPPGSSISFRTNFRYSGGNGFPPPARFKMFLSKGNIPDARDLIVNNQMVQFNKNQMVTGKFTLPTNLPAGQYYLISDLYSNNKKFRYSIPAVVQSLQVGKGQKVNELDGRSMHNSLEDINKLIYPNPFTSIAHIQDGILPETISSVKVYNLMGTCLLTLDESLTTFDLSTLPVGTYLLQIIKTDGEHVVEKIVKTF